MYIFTSNSFVEERNLLCPPIPPRQERVLYLALRLAEHRNQGEGYAEDRSAGHGVNRGSVEPVARQSGEFERPDDQHDQEHEHAVEPVVARFTGLGIDDVAGNPPAWQNELHQEKHGEDHERSEITRNGFRPG